METNIDGLFHSMYSCKLRLYLANMKDSITMPNICSGRHVTF